MMEIKKAYRRLAEKYHPDRTRERPEHIRKKFEKEMKLINMAKDVVLNPTSRSFYNYKLDYTDTVEVFEEEIEEVEPLYGESSIGEGLDRSIASTYANRNYMDSDEELPPDDMNIDYEIAAEVVEFYREETEIIANPDIAAEVIDIIEEQSEDESFDLRNDNRDSTYPGSLDDGQNDPNEMEKETTGNEDGQSVLDDHIPFWDDEPVRKRPVNEFKKIEAPITEHVIPNTASQNLFIKGTGYHLEVRPVSLYQDENVSIEVTASGLKYQDLKKRTRNRRKEGKKSLINRYGHSVGK
jgi:curved DNA-binding protein CbpA